MKYKNNFVIHTTEQLIDINKGLKDFEANITITSQNDDDKFHIVIVTQNQLDDTEFQMNYKEITNYINVNINSKKNEENDYILVLKSPDKVNVEILIDLVDKNQPNIIEESYPDPELTSDVEIESESESEVEDVVEDIVEQFEEKQPEKTGGSNKYFKYLKYLFIFVVLGLCIYFLFFTNFGKKKEKKESTTSYELSIGEVGEGVGEVGEGVGDSSGESGEVEVIETRSSGGKKKSRRSKKEEVVDSGQESLLEQLRQIREKG